MDYETGKWLENIEQRVNSIEELLNELFSNSSSLEKEESKEELKKEEKIIRRAA